VKVAVGAAALMPTDAGLNVPSAALGVTVTVPVSSPLAPTVKAVDATPATPTDGPLSVIAVAGTGLVLYVQPDGFVRPWLFVSVIVLAPIVPGV
jgi:hypothetical protein